MNPNCRIGKITNKATGDVYDYDSERQAFILRDVKSEIWHNHFKKRSCFGTGCYITSYLE